MKNYPYYYLNTQCIDKRAHYKDNSESEFNDSNGYKMEKIKIRLVTVGYLPFKLNFNKILKWKSDIFQVTYQKDEYRFVSKSNTHNWGYSDDILEKELPASFPEDIQIGITYVPLEDDFYSRRLSKNRVIFSLHNTAQLLISNNFELEKFLILDIYYYAIYYLINQNRIPEQAEKTDFAHHDTRKCIGDMHGQLDDIIFTLDKPSLCSECVNDLQEEKISNGIIDQFNKELKRIKKSNYNKISDFIKKNLFLSLILSILFGLSLNILGNLLFHLIFK